MKQGFLLLFCLSALTFGPSCRNKRNDKQTENENKAMKKQMAGKKKKTEQENIVNQED